MLAWFGIDDLKLQDLDAPPDVSPVEYKHEALSWYTNQKDQIRRDLLRAILKPFKYERVLAGPRADDFFGEVNSRHWVRAAKIGEMPILVVTPR